MIGVLCRQILSVHNLFEPPPHGRALFVNDGILVEQRLEVGVALEAHRGHCTAQS